ncbi:hypothetical protein GWI33_020429 [Rhynchophorus ferrugineus]|uniref:Mediator of RNA polymerase II transcription subunit 15 n=1 Tax=Rhynchophorus ferrugineus TaxID=354439 RepID=A0A834HWH6_RHYFE|nr:hypothetical protein GWI33_020429 [Rhynchophorus ferrugineus]
MSDSWKKETFRKSVENKINEAINQSNKYLKYGSKIEQAIFEKSNSKQEYLGYITRIVLDIRHMAGKGIKSKTY